MTVSRPCVLIIGAGFGGLFAARALANVPVDVLLIDRNNFHTFTPLLYQVATSALDPSEIAYPIRSIFRKQKNVRVLMGTVTAIDAAGKQGHIDTPTGSTVVDFDYLILASGSETTYFGNDAFRAHTQELRTLADAIRLRHHILSRFEQAAWSEDPERVRALTTIVVVGGGPTGLETAGAIFELYNHVLDKEYAARDLQARVVLVEMQPFLLGPYPEKLRQAAKDQLQSLGVEVILENPVTAVAADHIQLADGTVIPTHTLVWAAGVRASSLTDLLNVELGPAGRVPVQPTLQTAEHGHVYVIGDAAYLEDEAGAAYPMLIPVAQQQGVLAAKNIQRGLNGAALGTFSYHDRGIMATIGRRRAVAWIFNRVPLTGFLAWLAWLGLHLVTLIGFRNRVSVLIGWIWNYVTYDRSVRIILDRDP